VHGSGGPNEVWSYGEEAYGILKSQLELRERLRPYVMEQMRAAHESGRPVMRPLFYDFPADRKCWEIDDQYMFGPDIVVAPVVEQGARSRRVYLPAGPETMWIDAVEGNEHRGGTEVEVSAPLERIPFFLRKGSTVADSLLHDSEYG
jgi:alpha-D-xyloside xylohydrolase